MPDPPVWPHWAVEFDRLIAVRPQFVISGNIRDVFLTPTSEGIEFHPLSDCLFESLKERGCRFLIKYDQIDGLDVNPKAMRETARGVLGRDASGTLEIEDLPDCLRAVASARDVPCAFVIDYASRLVGRPHDLTDRERGFFAASEKIAHETRPLRASRPEEPPPFNPIVWLVNRPNDLPDWFVVRNQGIRALTASLPDHAARLIAARVVAKGFAGHDELRPDERDKLIGEFVDLTEGETLRSMMAIRTLARDQGRSLAEVSDAVRLFKMGLPDNPWRKAHLQDKLREPERVIHRRVKGQAAAVRKSMDILIRSVVGLSGAQASQRGGRPRGVLFFAGPTGVGKTELSKAIAQLILGNEQAYRRFDMSEFSSEQSEARLIGSPPGFIGHDAGGELVNAVRERPLSVLLFDEIEKAHPRILDKFLQILEDGRLTDGRGETVYFSEAVVIFTSNLGIYGTENGKRVQLVDVDTPPAQVGRVVREAIEDHFRHELERPELLNRLGDNIVVFNFINAEAAGAIFEMMLENVKDRVKREHAVTLEIRKNVADKLSALCTADLRSGGRGIGNRLETAFINPLAVRLFDLDRADGDPRRLVVRGITAGEDGSCTLEVE